MADDDDKNKTIFQVGGINTTGQTGGVNTQNFNFGTPRRQLDEPGRNFLRQIPAGRKFRIESPLGDSEAYDLGQQIEKFMISAGYVLAPEGSSQSVRFPPAAPGVCVDVQADPVIILVGPKP